jgi:peptidoglycan/xylan/chitin deacetylase (PgdA/CDA1 family)
MILSVDDGCASDVRLADLAQKYEIETIFYWPVEMHSLALSKGYQPLNYGDAYQIAQKHEIGSHTITHPHLTDLPLMEATYEIIASKTMLQQLFDVKVKKFCYPRGYANDQLNQIVLAHYESYRLTKGPGLVHIHPNSGANNNVHWLDRIHKDGIENIKEIWCHSWELNKYGMWDELEEFLRENAHS